MRITIQGQVTIPIEIREQLGLLPNTEVEFAIDRQSVRLTKARRPSSRSSPHRTVSPRRDRL